MFLELKRVNSKKFIEEIEELKNANLRQFFKKNKSIGSRQGESSIESISLPCHTEENLDVVEACERIAHFFSSISKEYTPINLTKVPERVQQKFKNPNIANDAFTLEDFEVYEKLKKRKL